MRRLAPEPACQAASLSGRSDDVDPVARLAEPTTRPPTGPRSAALAINGASGFLSLACQVAWFAAHVDRFGSTGLTFGLVLCLYIGGLGMGALASRRVTTWFARGTRSADGLILYGLMEMLAGAAVMVSAAALCIPLDLWGRLPYVAQDGYLLPGPLSSLVQAGVVVISVFVPCFFVGTGFPLLCTTFAGAKRFPSALYSWNTLGAAAGVLAGQFLLLPRLGPWRLLALAAAGHIVAGTVAAGIGWLTDGTARRFGASRDRPSGSPGHFPSTVVPEHIDGGRAGLLLGCALAGGALSGALQGDLVKRLGLLSGPYAVTMAFVSFWSVAALFAAARTVHVVRLRLVHIKLACLGAVLVHAVLTRSGWTIRQHLAGAFTPPATGSPIAIQATTAPEVFVLSGLFTVPAVMLIGLLLPWACDELRGRTRLLGLAYGLNTLLFCGGVLTTTWIMPRVSVFYSLNLFGAVLPIGAVFVALLLENRPMPAWRPTVVILLLAAAILFTPHGFDRHYVNPDGPAAHYPVRALRAGPMHTTFVVDDPLGVRLYFDNHSMSGNGFRARVYMRLMAHIPLLAHPDPGRALLIGFGVGNTAAAIGAHDTIERLDIVDLHRQVFETAPALREIHGGIQADPRVHLYVDDGRTFLQRPGPLYDLITTEPPPPQHAGVYRLYSREFYRDVLARLSPDGLMSQWLPTYQLPARITDGMIATFLDVFPHAALFTGYGREFVLVGGRTPIDFARIEERLATQPSVQDDLHALGVTSAVGLLARLVQDDGALRATFAGAPPRSDRAGDLLELLPSPPSRRVIPYDPGQVLSALGGAGTRHASVLTHLGRLMFHVPNFPADSLMTVRNSQSSPVELAMVDWSRVEELLERYTEARQRRDFGAAVEALEKELEVAHEQPAVLLELAQIYLGVGRPRDALETIERFRTLMPEEAAGWAVQGAALLDLGEPRRAEADLRRALEIDPRNVLASLYLEVMPARPRASFEEAGIPRSISLDHYVGWPNRRVQRTSEQKTKEPKG